MLTTFRSMFKNESGATAIEYTILIALVAIAIVGFSGPLQTAISGVFTQVNTALTPAAPAAGG